MTATTTDVAKVSRRLFLQHQLYTMLSVPPMLYVLVLVTELDRDQAWEVSKLTIPVLIPLLAVIVPYSVIRRGVHRAFLATPEEGATVRLQRMLELPGIIEATMIAMMLLGVGGFCLVAVLRFDKSPWTIPWAVADVGLFSLMVFILERRAFETTLRPYALAEFQAAGVMPQGAGGLLWPRQAWLLPYAFAIFVACTLATTLTILIKGGYGAYERLLQAARTAEREQFVYLVSNAMDLLVQDLSLPVFLLGGYLLVVSGLTAWRLAHHQTLGMRSVQHALEGLARGSPRPPDWVSTDEIGDLSATTTRIFDQLRSFTLSIKDAAHSLQQSAQQLAHATERQTEMLSVQASALQETQVTMQEIKNTSIVAAEKAGNILRQAERANDISRLGEEAIAQGLTSLEEVGTQVKDMATGIRSVDERARQIANITSLVKDLADRSNMLALNAAIEAVRSGESGKGFGVVAREIRALADQSIDATQNINSILQDITTAIATAATLSDKGAQRVEIGLDQVRELSGQVQQLTGIARDNASSVKQISAAVNQQDVGIAQITEAVRQLAGVMDQTMAQMRASEQAISTVRTVAQQVADAVERYGWNQKEVAGSAAASLSR